MKFVSIAFLAIFCLLGCKNSVKLKAYQDPFLDSFRGRKVKYLISYVPEYSDFADTTRFNEMGDRVQFISSGFEERSEYDSLHFITRLWQRSDVLVNLRYKYSLDESGILTQQCDELKSGDWRLGTSGESELFRVVFFKIDEEGKIVYETDTASNLKTLYEYDQSDKLVKKKECSLDSNKYLTQWSYEYNELSRVTKITYGTEGEKFLVHYFSSDDGVLDSTTNYIDGYTKRYRYIYY